MFFVFLNLYYYQVSKLNKRLNKYRVSHARTKLIYNIIQTVCIIDFKSVVVIIKKNYILFLSQLKHILIFIERYDTCVYNSSEKTKS